MDICDILTDYVYCPIYLEFAYRYHVHDFHSGITLRAIFVYLGKILVVAHCLERSVEIYESPK